jgi:DNA invertase Pin-like site-specific DNA recombinase
MLERPREIKASHIARKGIVYIRQSSDAQVMHNVGSTEAQRAQRRYAEAWGWASADIELIDDDLGLSGAAANHRPGYQRLLKDIEAGGVGAVFVSDESRLGRDTVEKLMFANLCILKKVLLVLNGRVADLADPATLLQTQISAVFSQHENLRRREHIRRGVEARLAAGKAITAPPAGYVCTEKGVWEKDPDPAVREALALVFTTFRRERSYYRAVAALRKMGVKVPRRRRGKPICFVHPTIGTLFMILKNPHYTGDYFYRRFVSDPTLGRHGNGAVRQRKASPDETVILENHPAHLLGRPRPPPNCRVGRGGRVHQGDVHAAR